jgi:hypothetical protein
VSRRRRALRRVARRAVAGLAFAGIAAAAGAQQPGRPPARPAPGGRTAADTVPRDSAGRRRPGADSAAPGDTSASRELVRWAEGDSVSEALRARPGYTVTRYQGDRVTFDAIRRVLRLAGDPSAVERGQTVVVADTIIYDDSTGIVDARRGGPRDSIVLRDPQRGSGDLVAGQVRYNLAARRASVGEFSTSVESGERWFVSGGTGTVVSDTAGPPRVYAHSGSITSCDESTPHYHFQAQELKVVGRNVLVARPAVLYIYDVPVMWLPFVFQDLRSGRRSGILSPRFGVSELVRNSPTYRRHFENLGYYFALNDYMDASVAVDWRSSANATEFDPGWWRYSAEWRYRWLDRFVTGRLFASQHNLSNPTGPQGDRSNTSFSWQHQQEFSARTRFNANVNFETSTGVRQNTALNPYTATATINSQANFQSERGPFTLSLGGSQTQYSGREDVTRNFPTLSVSAKPINLASWLLWTPTLSVSNAETINGQPLGAFAYRYFTNPATGRPDSAGVFRNTRNSSLQFGTPLRIFNFDWRNNVSVTEALNDFPDVRPIFGTVRTASGRDSAVVLENRVYARNFVTGVDWQTGIDLPQLFGGTWNLTPRVDIVNVESGSPLLIRTERTNGRYVTQGKRLQYGISSSPTLFGLVPGFGPVTRFRHSLTPSLSYSYAPKADVPQEFRDALNLNQSYLGGLAQSRVSLTVNQTLEGKLRPSRRAARGDSSATVAGGASGTTDAEGKKVKLLALNFSALEYDFVLADSLKQRGRAGWESGFVTPRFNYSARSDLVPGLNLDVGYSLFQGSVPSDTARFDPYRESVALSFAVNRSSGIFAALGRVFGLAGRPSSDPGAAQLEPAQRTDTLARRTVSQPYAGDNPFGRNPIGLSGPPAGQGWQASFSFSSTRQRPIVGNNVVNLTGTQICAPFQSDPIGFSQCTADPISFAQRFGGGTLLPGVDPNGLATTGGGQIFQTPAITTLQSNTSFAITPKWTAQWGTTYDFRNREFASHIVTLQRELHDWNATFAFTQAPNGNFAFNFFVALKAQPEVKFNYDRQSIRDNRSSF